MGRRTDRRHELDRRRPSYRAELPRDRALGVVATRRGSGDGRSLILNGHVDVVPPGDRTLWTHEPFGGAVVDGRIYGRGALDMKGPLLAGLYALRALGDAGVELAGTVHLHVLAAEVDAVPLEELHLLLGEHHRLRLGMLLEPEEPTVARLEAMAEPDAPDAGGAHVHTLQAELVGHALLDVGRVLKRVGEDLLLDLLGDPIRMRSLRSGLAFDEAEPLLREARAIRQELFPAVHPSRAVSLNNMGRLLQKKGDHAAADSLHQQAQSIYQQLYGATNLDAANTLYERAQAHRAMEDYAAAERFYEQAAAMQQSLHGPDHPSTQRSHKALAALYEAWGKSHKADSLQSSLLADAPPP